MSGRAHRYVDPLRWVFLHGYEIGRRTRRPRASGDSDIAVCVCIRVYCPESEGRSTSPSFPHTLSMHHGLNINLT
jgi:hypothetical protein